MNRNNLGGAHRTVTNSYRCGELNKITGTNGVVLLHEGDEVIDGVVDTYISIEVGLDGRKEKGRAVSSSSTATLKDQTL